MSQFAELLIEARDRLRRQQRKPVHVHFDWDGGEEARSWACWADADGPEAPIDVAYGTTGEQALRRFVETLRKG